jgi:hypothetical protein
MFGDDSIHPLDAILGPEVSECRESVPMSRRAVEHYCWVQQVLANWHREAADGREQRRAANAAARGQSARAVDFEVGDFVLVYSATRRSKLQVQWLGPQRVVDTVTPVVYVVEDLVTGRR